MSRDIEEIFDAIVTEKETHAILDNLIPNPDSSQTFSKDISSPSKVAIWRTQAFTVAAATKFHEDLFDSFKAFVEQRAQDVIPQTDRRLAILAKEFQYGDSLVFDSITGKFSYLDTTSTDAIDKKIIAQASVLSANRVVTYKVAKSSAGGGLEALVSAEVTAFTTYIDDTIVAGTKVIIRSAAADFLKLAYTIQYDPLQITSSGSLITDGTFPVQEAMDAYIKGLPFDGAFRVQDLTDKIQQARGIVNAVADVVEARDATAAYTDILAINTESYQPFSGHFATVDETGSEAVPVYGDIPSLNADAYNASRTYITGDLAIQNGITYKSNVVLGPESFDSTKWDTVSNITFIST